MHVRFQNSCKKRAEMQKKAENARLISKFMQKRAEMQKKKQKMHFNLKIHARRGQKWKKSTFIWIFSLLYPLCIFLHFNLKIHIKKTKMQKKANKFFQIAKINMEKKA